ncbi:glycosyltransferase [Tropicibacter sp. R15_0]|uniref:glycosyltransferase family 4 protein n=1 Tax=Tropicibacter sp. R15_0 TaxID=2821101 RepID=UPI001AD96D01|nr:glycosyltransferase [Tropicibacter sp. R15_0]MBO9464083.1 glycosyltransferase [Tropicibacter sp. R15_0]
MAAKDLNIAFLGASPTLDWHHSGGAEFFMRKALEAHAGQVTFFDVSNTEPPKPQIDESDKGKPPFDVTFLAPTVPLSNTLFEKHAPLTVHALGPNSIHGPARFADAPVLFLVDALRSIRRSRLLASSDFIIVPSDKTAKNLRLGEDSVEVVPWGANINATSGFQPKTISYDHPLQLLLITRNWHNSGGALSFQTLQLLRSSGIDAHLTIVGCVPPDQHVNEWVTVHPFLDKSKPEEEATFMGILRRSHFLLHPSAVGLGFPVCEASAFGVPTLCFPSLADLVRDNVNGRIFPVSKTSEQFYHAIRYFLENPGTYTAMSRSSRQEYEERLNWDAWGSATAHLLRDYMRKWGSGQG